MKLLGATVEPLHFIERASVSSFVLHGSPESGPSDYRQVGELKATTYRRSSIRTLPKCCRLWGGVFS